MELIPTGFSDLYLIKPTLYEDNRGYFYESYNKQAFAKIGLGVSFVQDNQSFSRHGVIRGLHYQLVPHAQSKLVRVLRGTVYDVAVDLRKGSPTYQRWFGAELSHENQLQLFIPHGFAHGFSVLSEDALVLYKTDDYYKKEAERGICFDDVELGINWRLAKENIVVSERDRLMPSLKQAENNFIL